MTVRADLLLFLLAPALLIAALSCQGGGGGEGCGERFGGPYPFGGPTPGAMNDQQKTDKQEAFQDYSADNLSLSKTTQLESMDQFENSIAKNLILPYGKRPYGVGGQVYNYVITTKCDILVATWNDSGVAEWKEDSGSDKVLTDAVCKGPRDFTPQVVQGIMINWAPEDPYGNALAAKPVLRSPCWLKAVRTDGILDAISKHFMLAQGENTTIGMYAEDWENAEVAYAGEILVDLTTCTYIVTNQSGTYKPPGEFRGAVNEFFAKELGRNSRKISNVDPWC